MPRKQKRHRPPRSAWLKAAAAMLAVAASMATAASQGNDSGVVTSGPPSCIVITSR